MCDLSTKITGKWDGLSTSDTKSTNSNIRYSAHPLNTGHTCGNITSTTDIIKMRMKQNVSRSQRDITSV
jgi:hypothetical protein